MSLWGRNNGMWASYQVQQNQNRAIYADHVIQQERITQGCQTINKANNVASINSGAVLTALKEGSQDYTCNEKTECLLRSRCPAPPSAPPYVAGPGQAQWTNMLTIGSTTSTNSCSIRGVSTDSSGNVYVIGYITDSTTPSTSIPIYDYISTIDNQINLRQSTTIPSIDTPNNNTESGVLIKYNKDGIAQWAVNFDSALNATGFSLVTDESGNVYCLYNGVANSSNPYEIYHMDPSTNTRVLYGTVNYGISPGSDTLIVKYNTNGTAQYVSLCGNVVGIQETQTTEVRSIAFDSTGTGSISYIFRTNGNVNIYHGAQPSTPGGSIVFGPANLFRTVNIDGGENTMGVVVRADASNLQILQATRISCVGGSGNGLLLPYSISIDSSGNNIVSGIYYNGTTTTNTVRVFQNDATTEWGSYSAGSMTGNVSDGFLLKYDNTLTPTAFTVITNGSGFEYCKNIVTDASGNIYMTGNANSTSTIMSFSNRTGTTINLTSFSTLTASVFLIKYNSNLQVIPNFITTIVKVTAPVQASNFSPFGLTIDASNNIYIAFLFNGGSVNINNAVSAPNGGPVTTSLYANVTNITPVVVGFNNSILVKYNPQFQAQWATSLHSGINSSTSGNSIVYDSFTDSVYMCGDFLNYTGNLNVQNFNRVSGGNLITDYYGKMVPNAVGVSTGQASGFLVKYKA
jgi:hypothetical protein